MLKWLISLKGLWQFMHPHKRVSAEAKAYGSNTSEGLPYR